MKHRVVVIKTAKNWCESTEAKLFWTLLLTSFVLKQFC